MIYIPVAGAYGSQWTTELMVRNESDEGLDITPCPYVCGSIAVVQFYGPHTTFQYDTPIGNLNGGKFLYIGAPGLGKVTFELRVQDISRQLSTWGTAIPVVREKDLYTGKLQLLNVPVSSDFRSALRVYDFDSSTDVPSVVRLRIYDMCGIGPFDRNCSNTPLIDRSLALPSGGEVSYTNPDHPGAAISLPHFHNSRTLRRALANKAASLACASISIRLRQDCASGLLPA